VVPTSIALITWNIDWFNFPSPFNLSIFCRKPVEHNQRVVLCFGTEKDLHKSETESSVLSKDEFLHKN
jgi:hypothetical protein